MEGSRHVGHLSIQISGQNMKVVRPDGQIIQGPQLIQGPLDHCTQWMIIRKATLGLHHVYMSLYMSLYVKRTTDGGNCLIAWFGALALGIVHVLFPFPCSDPFQA